ncbi:MAG TPA: ABC transporter substrate-binding protein [Thermoplasmata archaeon]|nr:ABC transporter substrate-binding protein [Thermoplasmata archaeon]
MRIVSLLPAATEICFALDLDGDLVGVSPECDYPPTARDRPALSRARVDTDRSTSADISQRVGTALARGDPLYEIDEEGMRQAAPDVILTQGLCEVCAPSVSDVRSVAARLAKKPRILALDPHSLKDVLEDIQRVGAACGAAGTAKNVVEELRERIERVGFLAAQASARPSTVCIEWVDPLFLAGHWVPEMVDIAGGADALVKSGEPSRRIEPKELLLAAPEVAILMPCGFHLDRARTEATALAAQSWWRDLPAARKDRVWVADGSAYFSRPGPRLVDGIEILAHILHPEIFPRPPSPKDAAPWVG